MRYLKLCIILCCFSLLADNTKLAGDDAHINIESVNRVKDQKSDMPPPTPVEEKPVVDIHKTTDVYEMAFVKMIVVLIALLTLVILTIWMFKKFSRGRLCTLNYLKSIKILEKRPLSPKSMLYLIEIRGKQVLLSESQFEVRSITTLEGTHTPKDL